MRIVRLLIVGKLDYMGFMADIFNSLIMLEILSKISNIYSQNCLTKY